VVLSFDPHAGELVIDREDGRPRFEISLDRLVVKHYADGGILFAELGREDVVVGILPDIEASASVEVNGEVAHQRVAEPDWRKEVKEMEDILCVAKVVLGTVLLVATAAETLLDELKWDEG
jgi:hypothetical protein